MIDNKVKDLLKRGFISLEFVIIGAVFLLGTAGIMYQIRKGNKNTADVAVDRINKDNAGSGDISSTPDKGDEDFDTGPEVVNDDVPPIIYGVHDIVTDVDVEPDYVTGIKAVDDVDGMVDVIIDDSQLNYHIVGEYEIYYSASDSHGNTAHATATIKVKDSDVPVILGVKPIVAEVNTKIDYLKGVTVKENSSGEKITPTYDASKVMESVPGQYPITYYAVDMAGNEASLSTTVTIQDNTPPVLYGLHTIDAMKGVIPEYLSGITAWDNVDGVITERITYDAKDVNINKPGQYQVTYCVSDTSEYNNNNPKGPNTTCENAKVIVKDGVKPVLHNVKEKTVEYKNNLDATLVNILKEGVYATDDSDLTEDLVINVDISNVNLKTLGSYPVTYSVTDSSGNMTSQTSQVHIVDTTGPVISGNKDITIRLGETPVYGLGVKAVDEYEGNVELHWDISSVVVNKGGKYGFSYWAEDSRGNKTTVINYVNIIDDEGPVFEGVPDMIYHEYGSTPNVLEGIKAIDNNDGPVPIEVDVSEVDFTALNEIFNVHLTAEDSNHNVTKITVPLKIVDTTPPAIYGIHDFIIAKGEMIGNYLDGIYAEDNYDGPVQVDVDASQVNIDAVGSSQVIYTARDSNGNINKVTATVTVKDLTPPELSGISDYHYEYGDPVPDKLDILEGVTAYDDTDGPVTDKIIIMGYEDIDFETLNEYPITIAVTDNSNNTTSIPSKVIVEDTTPPEFSGVVDIECFVNEKPSNLKAGITAYDIYDKEVTDRISYTTDAKFDVPGIYTITYEVSDTHGNKNTSVANIMVKDKNKPVFSGIKNPLTIEAGDEDYDYYDGITAEDPEDGPVTDTIYVDDSKVDYYQPGQYTVEYMANDKFNNVTSVFVTVNIVDTTPPEMTYGEDFSTDFPDVDAGINDKEWMNEYISNINISDIVTQDIEPVFDFSKANFKNPGTYPVVISATDEAGNSTKVTINMTITDVSAPVIEISKETIELGYNKEPSNIRDFYMGYIYSVDDDKDGSLLSTVVIDDSDVDYETVGNYVVKVSAEDSSGNVANAQLNVSIVDKIKPVLSGAKPISMTLYDYINNKVDFTEGLTAWDEYKNTNLTDSIHYVVNNGNDVYSAGTYSIVYTVSDGSGNEASATTTLTINGTVDTPMIVLNSNTLKLTYNNKPSNPEQYFRDNIKSANDATDGPIKDKIKITYPTIDYSKIGNYEIVYSYTNSKGKTSEVKATLSIVDDVKPVITGAKNITISLEEYSKNTFDYMEGISAWDEYDKKDLTDSVEYVINDGYMILGAGNYTLTYYVKDASENMGSVTVTLTITDTTDKPVILLTTYGLTFQYGETPIDENEDNWYTYFANYVFSANDPEEGDISDSLEITHDVLFNKIGLYSVTFTVENSKGVTASAKMLVNVEDKIGPEIKCNNLEISADEMLKYVDLNNNQVKTEFKDFIKPRFEITDNYDASIPDENIEITYKSIIENGLNDISVYVKATDSQKNESNDAFKFTIVGDATITVKKAEPITLGMSQIRDTMNGKNGMTIADLFKSFVTARYGTTELPNSMIEYALEIPEDELLDEERIIKAHYKVFSTKKEVQFKIVNDLVDNIILKMDNAIDEEDIESSWATSRYVHVTYTPTAVKVTKYQQYISDTKITDLSSLDDSTAWKDFTNGSNVTTTGRYIYLRACQTKDTGETLCSKAYRFVLAVDTTAPVDSKVNAYRKDSNGNIITDITGLSNVGISQVNGEYQTKKWDTDILYEVVTQKDNHSGFAKLEYQIGENPSNNSAGGTTAVTDSNAVWGIYNGSTWQANQWATYTNKTELKSSGWLIRFRVCDKLNNCRTLTTRPYLVDNVNPSSFTVSGVGTDENISWAKSRTINLSGSIDKHSAVKQYEYCIKKNTTDSCTWSKFTNGTFTGTGKYIQFRVVDNVGHVYTNNTNYVLKVDSTTPVINSVTGASTTWATNRNFTINNSAPLSSSLTYYYAMSASPTSGYGSWINAGTGTTTSKVVNVANTGKYVKFKVCLTNVPDICSEEKSGFNAYVDKTAPVISGVTGTSTTPAKSRTITLNTTDAHSGLARAEWATTNTFADKVACASATSCTISGKTVKQVYVRVYDKVGNVSSVSGPHNVYVDVTPPTAITISGGSTTWAKSRTLTISESSDTMSSLSYKYCASSTESDCVPYNSAKYKDNGTNRTVTYNSGTAKYFYAVACDALGNCTSPVKADLYVDNTIPTITATGGSTTWANSRNYTLAVADTSSYSSSTPGAVTKTGSQSQVARYEYYVVYENGTNSGWKQQAITATDSTSLTATIKENLGKTIKFRAVDKAGNISAESSTLNLYTQTSFTITATGSTTWSNAASRNVALSSTCKGTTTYTWTDSTGSHSTTGTSLTYNVAAGTSVKTATISATCIGNNASATANIYIDRKAPTGITIGGQSTTWAQSRSITISGGSDDQGGTLTYKYCASSVESDCATYNSSKYNTYSSTLNYTLGTAKFIYATACDARGNCATPVKGNLYVDRTKPTVSASGGGTNWTTSRAFTVSTADASSFTSGTAGAVAHTSPQSGISKWQYALFNESWGTVRGWTDYSGTSINITTDSRYIQFRAIDVAGNISDVISKDTAVQSSWSISVSGGSTSWSNGGSRSFTANTTCKGTTTFSWSGTSTSRSGAGSSSITYSVGSGSAVKTATLSATCTVGGGTKTATMNVYLDRIAPTVTNGGAWYSGYQMGGWRQTGGITAHCSDSHSGCPVASQSTSHTPQHPTDAGESTVVNSKVLQICMKDNAGNSACTSGTVYNLTYSYKAGTPAAKRVTNKHYQVYRNAWVVTTLRTVQTKTSTSGASTTIEPTTAQRGQILQGDTISLSWFPSSSGGVYRTTRTENGATFPTGANLKRETKIYVRGNCVAIDNVSVTAWSSWTT